MAVSQNYNSNVFINCPFDDEYNPLMQAITFAVYRCGFYPKCALQDDDGTQMRLDKIYLLIEDCKYGIHDISRTELDDESDLPRFNMPFELGLFFSAKKFGSPQHRKKQALIVDREQYRYMTYISDLNGVDIRAHNNETATIIGIVRSWLLNASKRKTIPGTLSVRNDFDAFSNILPELVEASGLELGNLSFNDFCYIVEEWLDYYLESA